MNNKIKLLVAWIRNDKKFREEFRLRQLLDQFDNNCVQIHNETNKFLPKDIIYHYTSYNGLKGILEKKRLRYTDYRYFNDPTELKYSSELIRDAMLDSILRHNHYLIRSALDIFDNFDKYYKIYISCFSEQVKKLALWRYYASNGSGFAIGFNKNFHKVESYTSSIGKSCVCRVSYGTENPRNEVDKFLGECTSLINVAGEASLNRDFLKNVAVILISHLIPLLPVFKDSSFEDEEEIRLFHMEGPALIDPKTKKPYFIDDKYREFVPFCQQKIPFVNALHGKKPAILPDTISSSDISEIVVGPCCEFSEARTWIRKLLSDNNFDLNKIEIKQVELPYRNF